MKALGKILPLMHVAPAYIKEYDSPTTPLEARGCLFIYLGEIEQMPGHGVFVVHYAPGFEQWVGRVLSGLHMDRFEMEENDTT